MEPYVYPGQELALFEGATKWKGYFEKKIRPFISGHVLEVGAGIGSTTKALHNETASSWTMMEPDELMCRYLQSNISSFPQNVSVLNASVGQVKKKYNTILYIDVLEHIEDDKAEMRQATEALERNGHLVVLSPAFQFLFSEFDRSIGHFRRYRKKELLQLAPDTLSLVSAQYLDSLGFFASAMNKFFLHQSYPTKKQVELWDRNFIPVSRIIDPLLFHSFGKSILAVWQKK